MDIYNQILLLLDKEFHLSEGTKYIPDGKKTMLKKVSNILEVYWDEQSLESIELIAGTGNNSLYVSLSCEDIIVENGRNNALFRLVTFADSVRFSQKNEAFLCMELQFKGITQNRQPQTD